MLSYCSVSVCVWLKAFSVCLFVIQAALMQLIQYYHRFQKVLSQAPFKQLTVRSELLNIHHLMVEVKKYKPNF